MKFEEAYYGWTEAARLFGVCERTFRRYIDRYEEEGLDGLIDKQLEQSSHRRAPAEEIVALTERYRKRHLGPKRGRSEFCAGNDRSSTHLLIFLP